MACLRCGHAQHVDVDYAPSEDPVEAMSLLAAAMVTRSSITIRRVPIEFLEVELAMLGEMGFDHTRSQEYVAQNGYTRLVDITNQPSELQAPADKTPPMPLPDDRGSDPLLRGRLGLPATGATSRRVVLLAMLASEGTSILRGTYVIRRGYEKLAQRLNGLGAQIEQFG